MNRLLILVLFALASTDVQAKPVMKSKAITSDVQLPTEIVAFAERNRTLFEGAKTSPEAFCEFVADSLSLLKPLEDAVVNGPSPDSDDDSGAYGAETAGAAVYVVESGVHIRLQWKNLLSVAAPASRALVLAMQALGGDADFGAWIEQTTDMGGCHRPELALAALKKLSAALRTAPACLRDVFRPELVDQLSWMTRNRCFCESEAKRADLQRHLADNARVLSQIAGIGAPFARKLRALASDPGAKFNCGGPG